MATFLLSGLAAVCCTPGRRRRQNSTFFVVCVPRSSAATAATPIDRQTAETDAARVSSQPQSRSLSVSLTSHPQTLWWIRSWVLCLSLLLRLRRSHFSSSLSDNPIWGDLKIVYIFALSKYMCKQTREHERERERESASEREIRLKCATWRRFYFSNVFGAQQCDARRCSCS